MANYAKNAKDAYAQIRKAGIACPLTRTTPGAFDPAAGAVSGSTTTTTNIVAVILPATATSIRDADNRLLEDKSLVISKCRLAVIAALGTDGQQIPEVEPEDRLTFDGKSWRVASCTPLKPAETAILYKAIVIRE